MKAPLLSLFLWLAGPAVAQAATAVESARAQASSSRAEVLRLRAEQQSLREALHGLAEEIESMKARRRGKLVAGAELEGALRRSQELTGTLTGLAQQVAQAESASERGHLALEGALSEELRQLRAQWEREAARPVRLRLISRMRRLRAERDAVRAALPASQVPALDRGASRDDPEDLLEQADALRDAEDKVRARLQSLRGRIAEAREEQALDRRMRDFLGDEAIFDEQDRRLRLRRDATAAVEADRSTPSAPENAADAAQETVSAPGPGEAPPGGGAPMPPAPSLAMTPPARAQDSRPQVGKVLEPSLAGGEGGSLASLQAQEAELSGLAAQLKARAEELERRGRALEAR